MPPIADLTRRDLLRLGLAAGAAFPLGIGAAAGQDTPGASPSGTLDAAIKAARWIRTARVETPAGYLWISGPERPEGMDTSPGLYSGVRGHRPLSFGAGARHGRQDLAPKTPRAAPAIWSPPFRRGCDPDLGETGLYTGAPGIGFTLFRAYQETGDSGLRDAAERCRNLIHAAAQPAGQGVEWGAVTDIIAGAAGIGLYLLDRARNTEDPASRDLAVRAGLRLIELGIEEKGGRKWRMDPEFKRLMPNFSHGTAGVAYFLATLHKATGRQEFLDAALAGARYLQAIANTGGIPASSSTTSPTIPTSII